MATQGRPAVLRPLACSMCGEPTNQFDADEVQLTRRRLTIGPCCQPIVAAVATDGEVNPKYEC